MDNTVAPQATAPTASGAARWKEAVSELAEARLQQLVAQRLGVGTAQLQANASLGQDLGADETDLLEIAVALEEEFGVVVSDAVLGRVQTYGDLSASVARLLQNLADADAAELLASGIARVRVIRTASANDGAVLRAVRLTPRVIEGIIQEALATAEVVRLEVSCASDTNDHQLARIAQRLGWLRNRGVQVSVQRMGQDNAALGGTAGHTRRDTLPQSVTTHPEDQVDSSGGSRGIGFAG
jgi:acyl carrier protein